MTPRTTRQQRACSKPLSARSFRAACLLAALIGTLFALPHIVRIATLGSYAAYSPFTAHSPSPMVFDETFLYAAQANHVLTRGELAYDDTWEYRNVVYPYSVLPTALEAALALVVHSLKLAHILLAFLFPAFSALLLMVMFRKAGAGAWLSAFLALFVLVGAFSPMTLKLDALAFLHHAQGARAFDSLQAARMPNPAITFLQLAAALLLLAESLRRDTPSRTQLHCAAAAGVLGGLLYFSYIYYAITWSVLIGALALLSLLWQKNIARKTWLALAITVAFAGWFMAWRHMSASYAARAARIGLYHSHAFVPEGLTETWLWGGQALICAVLWLWLRRTRNTEASVHWRFANALMPVLLAAMASGIAGMNMQVVTGFNLQQVQHYPHMVLQPVGFIMMAVLLSLVYPVGRPWRLLAATGFVLAITLCAMAQVEAGRDTAQMHRLTSSQRELFAWLNANTPVGSVLATDDLALSVVLPVQTHNSVLFADGSRSSAPDEELIDRFLLASRLAGTSPAVVEQKLSGHLLAGEDIFVANYPLYLFEFSLRYQRIPAERRIAPDRIGAVIDRYRALDPAASLASLRVDYLFTRPGIAPPPVPGWTFTSVLSTAEGTLWQLTHR